MRSTSRAFNSSEPDAKASLIFGFKRQNEAGQIARQPYLHPRQESLAQIVPLA
jgi:hypothetical protein